MTKRKLISFCLIILFLSFLPTSKCMAETPLEPLDDSIHFTNNISDDKDVNKEIQELIEKYFKWYNENMKNGLATFNDINLLVENDSLVDFKKSKVKWFYNFNKELEMNLKSYTINADLNSVEENGEYIDINIVYGEKLITENAEDITQELHGQEHQLVIQNINGNYKIINDYYLDELMGEDFSKESEIYKYNQSIRTDSNDIKMQEKANEFEVKLNNLDLEVDKVRKEAENRKNQSSVAMAIASKNPYICKSYDPAKAVKYAKTHYEHNNPYFPYYPKGDCQNFVSQCLDFGGIPRDVAWYVGSRYWKLVVEFEDWANRQKSFARVLSWQENTTLGDVVQFYNARDGWHHSMIVTYRDSSGYLYVTGHTDNYINKPINNISETKRYLIFTS